MSAVESLQLMIPTNPSAVPPISESDLQKELVLYKEENDRLREDLRREKVSSDVHLF